ncbi:MAG: CRISPR-associated endonuclease Cas1 [Acidobacteria bacterium]|nr:CRISPR-associated endonuclease Cas1 [Acidobacteriota bacterium]
MDAVNTEPLPVRMLSEFAYCRRLFHLMHVEGLWEDNQYTRDGQWVHRRLDEAVDAVLDGPKERASKETETAEKEDQGDPEPKIARSVTLSSERLGIIAKLDLVATEGDEAVPVDTKRGRVPANQERSWEPERVQIAAQALLLREHGFRCERGVLYFAGSRTRVDVMVSPELEARTFKLIEQARQASLSTELPPPLDDSPKCIGCSLAGICLPDETNALLQVAVDPSAMEVRRLYPARDDAQPLYVQEQGAKVGKSGEALIVRNREGVEVAKVPLKDVSELVLCGNVQISSQTVHLLCEAGVPIVYVSGGHWFYGITTGVTLRNAYDRAAQFAAAADPMRCVDIAREFVMAKGANQRTLLRRNGEHVDDVVLQMSHLIRRAESADTLDELLGVEGNLAKLYFGAFSTMLRPRSATFAFDFESRNRRPPKDPVNTLLSFAYAMLVKDCTVALLAAGLDPFWGFFHQPRHGRPALALDLMEEFRPLIADSAVLTAINTGAVDGRNFVVGDSGCALHPAGRKKFIQTYASRMDQLVTHPKFDYRCTWRQILRLQARILARHLRGEIECYEGMTTR